MYKCSWCSALAQAACGSDVTSVAAGVIQTATAYSCTVADVTTKWWRGPWFLIAHSRLNGHSGDNSDKIKQKMSETLFLCLQLHNFIISITFELFKINLFYWISHSLNTSSSGAIITSVIWISAFWFTLNNRQNNFDVILTVHRR